VQDHTATHQYNIQHHYYCVCSLLTYNLPVQWKLYFNIKPGCSTEHPCHLFIDNKSPWTGDGLNDWRSAASRWTSRSTTSTVIIDLGTGCMVHGHAFEPSATAHFPLQQQGHATVCRRKWRHHEHSHLLNPNWKHIYLNCHFLIATL